MAIIDKQSAQEEVEQDLKKRRAEIAKDISEILEHQKGSAKQRLALVKATESLKKQDRSLGGDLAKNLQDMKDGVMSGIDGFINESFGPLGGIVSSFTTGWFKRSKDNVDNLEATENTLDVAQSQLDSIKGVEESAETISENTKKNGGEAKTTGDELGFQKSAEDLVDERTTRIEQAGGVAELNDELTGQGGEGGLLGEIRDHVKYIAENMEDAESRRERLRMQKTKKAGGAVVGKFGKEKGMEDDGSGFGIMDIITAWLGYGRIKSLLSGMLTGKGGLLTNLFRNLKAVFLKQGKNLLGTAKLLPLLRKAGTFAKIGGLSVPILGLAIDGLLGAFEAEDWGTSIPSATIGGALMGGESGGWNMFGQSMKYAAMGGALGSIVPGVGTIAGALLGGIIGALFGWIGGKKFAQTLETAINKVTLSQNEVDDAVQDAILSEEVKKKIKEGKPLTRNEQGQKNLADIVSTTSSSIVGSGEIVSQAGQIFDPTGSNFLGSGLGLGNLPFMPKEGIIGAPLMHLFSLGESGFWNSPEEIKEFKKKTEKFSEGGIVAGPKGKAKAVIAHGGERFFDNESSEKIERAASLLEGTDFKSVEEFVAAGKSSVGYSALMDKFSPGMLSSKHGGALKNAAIETVMKADANRLDPNFTWDNSRWDTIAPQTGAYMNQQQMESISASERTAPPVVVNQIDNSVRQSTLNQAPRVINAAGPELTGRYGDFLTRVG